MGKGLSKDDKAQKLALRHWLEAVRPLSLSLSLFIYIYVYTQIFSDFLFVLEYRLIQGIDTGTIYICTMMSGLKARAHSLSSTGECSAMASTCYSVWLNGKFDLAFM